MAIPHPGMTIYKHALLYGGNAVSNSLPIRAMSSKRENTAQYGGTYGGVFSTICSLCLLQTGSD